MSEAYLTAFLVAVLAAAMPLLLAAVGETIGEQSGVLGLGIEGLLLTGGFTGFAVADATGSFWLGFACGGLAGLALSTLLMVLSVWLRVNQIVVGLGTLLLGTGISSLLYEAMYAGSKPRLGDAAPWRLVPLAELPVVGPALFAQPGLFYVACAVPLVAGLWLWRSAPGLRLRAAGQGPAALDAAGGSVTRIRSLAVLCGGALSGLAGAYLSLVSAGTFTPGMTHGLGFLAIVVAMLARGRMRWVVAIALVYGCFVGAATALQFTSVHLPGDAVQAAPFVAVLIVLALVGRRSHLPPALATAYVRGAR